MGIHRIRRGKKTSAVGKAYGHGDEESEGMARMG